MHELLPSLHPANRVYVDEYLNGYSMDTIEGILRSTKSVTDGQQSQIAELAQFYTDTQETALRTNLKEVSYVISSVADATLVAGPARAESVGSILLFECRRFLLVMDFDSGFILCYTFCLNGISPCLNWEGHRFSTTARYTPIGYHWNRCFRCSSKGRSL